MAGAMSEDMDFIDWMHETHRMADAPLKAALAAAERGDAASCGEAAWRAAVVYLRRYLGVVGDEEAGAGDGVARLLEAAARHDHYFERVRAEAALLDGPRERGTGVEDLVNAMKEIRYLAMARAGKVCGFSVLPEEPHPVLMTLLTHSTPVARACSIFAAGALLSFNKCKRRGVLSGEPLGSGSYILDPRRLADFVLLGHPENKHSAGEKVSHSQRKGIVDEAMEDDYQPGVRLFFHRREIEGLPGLDSDGMHEFMVRDQVSLDHLVCAVFPSEQARDEALARVKEPARREWLAARCLAAPPECCRDPQSYVRATNEMVAERVSASPSRG
jgi:hypothetical protein